MIARVALLTVAFFLFLAGCNLIYQAIRLRSIIRELEREYPEFSRRWGGPS